MMTSNNIKVKRLKCGYQIYYQQGDYLSLHYCPCHLYASDLRKKLSQFVNIALLLRKTIRILTRQFVYLGCEEFEIEGWSIKELSYLIHESETLLKGTEGCLEE